MNSLSITHATKLTCIVLISTLIAGCAAPSGPGASSQSQDPCDAASSAVAGAIGGALLGMLIGGKDSAAQGAAVGAIGATLACLAIKAQSNQTKSAAQADNEFQKAKGSLPKEPQVTTYIPSLQSRTVARGQPVLIRSIVELVNGTSQPVNSVREELVVMDTSGTPIRSGSKTLNMATAGRYENSFELKLPESAPQGIYKLKTNLYVNNQLALSRDLQTQLVLNTNNELLMAMK